MNFNLPPWVFSVHLKRRTWLTLPDWECVMSFENSQSRTFGPTPEVAFDLALAEASRFTPRPIVRVPFDFGVNLDI